jgi:hypothetical protein
MARKSCDQQVSCFRGSPQYGADVGDLQATQTTESVS